MKTMRMWQAMALGLVLQGTQAVAASQGFYIAAAAGRAEQDIDRDSRTRFINITTPAAADSPRPFVPQRSTLDVDGKAFGWNIALGYRVNAYFAAELTYMSFGRAEITETPGVIRVSQLPPNIVPGTVIVNPGGFSPFDPTLSGFLGAGLPRFRSEIDGPALSVLGSLPIAASWNVYLRAGVIFAEQDVTPIDSTGGRRVSFHDEVLLGGIGGTYTFSPRFSLRAEYQRSDELGSRKLAASTRLEQLQLSIVYQLQ